MKSSNINNNENPFNKSYVTKKDVENVKVSMIKESLEGGEKKIFK